MPPDTVENATCTFCGCVCDHIGLEAEGDRIVKTKRACGLGEAWFKNHTAERLYPEALIHGKPASVGEAVEEVTAWELIDAEAGRYMPRRIRGSFRGRALG